MVLLRELQYPGWTYRWWWLEERFCSHPWFEAGDSDSC